MEEEVSIVLVQGGNFEEKRGQLDWMEVSGGMVGTKAGGEVWGQIVEGPEGPGKGL